MKSLVNLLAAAIVIMVLAALAYGLCWSGGHLWARLGELEAATRIVLLTAVAGGLLAALIVAAGLRSAARGLAQGRLLEDRLDLYRELFDRHHAALRMQGCPAERAPEALDLELGLLAAGSVIDAHSRLVAARNDPEADPQTRASGLSRLLKAMRRDLGHAQGLDDGKLDALSLLRAGDSSADALPGAPHHSG